jgi:hypothetical protein
MDWIGTDFSNASSLGKSATTHQHFLQKDAAK